MDRNTSDDSSSLTFVTQFFHPDTSANSIVLTDLATGLAERGFSVSVITGQPSYSSNDREKTRRPTREVHEGVPIRRLPATRFDKNESTIKRLFNELSFFLSTFLYLFFRRQTGTLVLPTAPPFLPILGCLLRFRGYDYIPIVYDIYPDMAARLGYLSEDGLVYRIWSYANSLAYSNAEAVITIGDTMRENIEETCGDLEEVDVIVRHNWEDGEFIKPQSKKSNDFAQEHGLVDKFTLIYSGNIGLFHGLGTLIDAASELESLVDDPTESFKLLFIGEGGMKEELRQRAEKQTLTTVEFLPYQPMDDLPDTLTSGDVSLVTMRDDTVGLCVPSKFYTSLASGQAILAVARRDSEIGRIVEETGCGIRVDPGSPEGIVDAVQFWLQNPDKASEMGERARAVFEDRFEKSQSLDRWAEAFRKVA